MSKEYWLLKAFKTIGLALILGVSLTACGAGNIEWKEEVQLSDGNVIVVERAAIYEAGGDEWASNRSGSKINEYRIRFEYPTGSGKLVEWHSTKKDMQTYPEVPLVIDMVSSQPTIYTLIAISAGCEVYSKYVYQSGKWKEEILPKKFEQHTTNLLFGSKRDLPQFLNLQEKYKRNNGPGYRKAVKYVGPDIKICGG